MSTRISGRTTGLCAAALLAVLAGPLPALAQTPKASAAAPATATGMPSTSCGGDLISVASGATVTLSAVVTEITKAGVVALGERHGVRAHPQAAACLLRTLAAAQAAAPARSTAPSPAKPSAAPALVMEMLTADQQPVVDKFRQLHPEVMDGLGTELKWWETGWPAWPVYAPLIDTAWRTRAPVRGGDLGKAAKPMTAEAVTAALGAAAPATVASWSAAMKTAHCDLIDDAKSAELARKQVSRDVSMADAVAASRKTGAVTLLYAGRAHVRKDRSVPLLLAGSTGPTGPSQPAVAVALQETTIAGKPIDRAAALADAKGRYDYVWFTGVAEQGDACERLRSKGLIAAAPTGARPGAAP
jgi:uncharacterized iron-regulated protein